MKKAIEKYTPKLIVLVVYKTKNGNWRGFCNPYNVTCEARNGKETMSLLKESVKLYEEGLKKYGYPKHLSLRLLSNKQDKTIFDKVIKIIARKLKKDFIKFQAQKEKERLKTKSPVSAIYYSYQQPCFV